MKPSAIRRTSSFARNFKYYLKSVSKKDRELLAMKLDLFYENIFSVSLRTHKLGGKLKNMWAFSISHSDRIIFEIHETEVVLHDIGDHDVYR